MKVRPTGSAFTLIELLTVMAIIGVLAALTAPVVSHFRKGDAMAAATRQLLDAVHRGRQLAISQHTTVYMVFAPTNLWTDPVYGMSLTPSERAAALSALEKAQTGYAFVSLRSVGDQPGRSTPRYLSTWETLPDSTFIPHWKFNDPLTQIRDSATGVTLFTVRNFTTTRSIPFPSEDAAYNTPSLAPYATLPYIAFDYLGRLTAQVGAPHDEYIPLAHGSVSPARDPATRLPTLAPPDERELPPGNSTNSSYNVIHIDWLTGRARVERQEVK